MERRSHDARIGFSVFVFKTEFFLVRSGLPQELRRFLTTGLLGAFTTFSLDRVSLWERGQWVVAAGYAGLSLAASITGLFNGLLMIRFAAQGS
ncbi:CrcB-like protein, Camphor Resistance (CrcB) [Rhizobium aethiopicum]|uniref:Fluoride-specific ion channel n=1 Tax=Rhizobium aethiopicum TaxID=1138170 RepID=A0A1C3Y263_9HYPH|nr:MULTISPECIES: CrcB family protein [Rhizobium]SCB58555.1 CrcB-like protein, Camphor Resistance (CrcB) [Rhizobium aethiopicum]